MEVVMTNPDFIKVVNPVTGEEEMVPASSITMVPPRKEKNDLREVRSQRDDPVVMGGCACCGRWADGCVMCVHCRFELEKHFGNEVIGDAHDAGDAAPKPGRWWFDSFSHG